MKSKLEEILDGKQVDIPIYDFKTHTRYHIPNVMWFCSDFLLRKSEVRTIYPVDVVLFEGILVLYDPEIRDMMQMKLFVDTDSDTRLARRGQLFMQLMYNLYHYRFNYIMQLSEILKNEEELLSRFWNNTQLTSSLHLRSLPCL